MCHIDAESVLSGPQMLSSSPAVFTRSMAYTGCPWKCLCCYVEGCDENVAGPSSWPSAHRTPEQNGSVAKARYRGEAQRAHRKRREKDCTKVEVYGSETSSEFQRTNFRRSTRDTRPANTQDLSLMPVQKPEESNRRRAAHIYPHPRVTPKSLLRREGQRCSTHHTRSTPFCHRRRAAGFRIPFPRRGPPAFATTAHALQIPSHTGYHKLPPTSMASLCSAQLLRTAREKLFHPLGTPPSPCTSNIRYPSTSPSPLRMPTRRFVQNS